MSRQNLTEKQYLLAQEQYEAFGIDTDKVIDKMKQVVISLHCWQADDVGGFETPDAVLSGGGIRLLATIPAKQIPLMNFEWILKR